MDTTETTHISLCAGYGGIDIGLSRAIPNLRTIAFSEIEAFACANLVSKMEAGLLDAAPIWTDLKTFPWEQFRGLVDILSGGYPCQPFSAAGKRLGDEDPRHLWPHIASGISIARPGAVFFENVEGHVSMGLREVLADLVKLGYRVEGNSGEPTWGIFSASEVGAPHQRKRVFILAVADMPSERLERYFRHLLRQGETERRGSGSERDFTDGGLFGGESELANAKHHSGCSKRESQPWKRSDTGPDQMPMPWPSRPGEPQHEWEPPRTVGYTKSGGFRIGWNETRARNGGYADGPDESLAESSCQLLDGTRASSREAGGSESANGGEWQAESPLGGNADGIAGGLGYAELCVSCDNRTDELRLLGNGVVPATATKAFVTLLSRFFPTN